MTPEVKLATLAVQSTALQAFFGPPPLGINGFRWYDTRHAQGSPFPSVTVLRVSTARMYRQEGLGEISEPRFQIDVRSPDPEVGRAAAKAVVDWLGTVDLASDDQFGSPATTPRQFPSYLLNQRHGMDYQLEPPVHVEHLDVRVFNKEE